MDKAKNGGRVFIAKNRNGPDGIVFPIFMDTSCVKIDILPRQTITTDNNPNTSKNMLREKYVKYMTNKNGSNVT